jgi:hypothetical protein
MIDRSDENISVLSLLRARNAHICNVLIDDRRYLALESDSKNFELHKKTYNCSGCNLIWEILHFEEFTNVRLSFTTRKKSAKTVSEVRKTSMTSSVGC